MKAARSPIRIIVACTAFGLLACTAGQSGFAQETHSPSRPHAQAAALSFTSMTGRRVNAWGVGEAYRFTLERNGRGTLSLYSRLRREVVTWRFRLTAEQLAEFTGHVDRFRSEPQDDSLCATDQAFDILQWEGPGGQGMARHDHGCASAANQTRVGHLNAAIEVLRTAARADARVGERQDD